VTPHVVFVGAGGIGHPAIAALAHAEVRITVIDDDRIEPSNLHRLALADDRDIGAPKADVARRVRNRDGDATIFDRVTPDVATRMFATATLVVEGSDNYATKFLVADACGLLGIPSVHGAAVAWMGTVLPVVPGNSACYRCVFEDLPEGDALDCATAGVYGPVTSLIGGLMAAEAMRLLAGDARHAGSVAQYDGWRQTFRSVGFERRPGCALCGTRAIRALDPSRYIPQHCLA
jgi:molybdopterin/thiamine biosynthesis adenylyltransferase